MKINHVYPNPVTTAIDFLCANTTLDTERAIGSQDPDISNTVFVEHLFRDGEEVQAIVYLETDGYHDFEVSN